MLGCCEAGEERSRLGIGSLLSVCPRGWDGLVSGKAHTEETTVVEYLLTRPTSTREPLQKMIFMRN